jgi:hypothetical protein
MHGRHLGGGVAGEVEDDGGDEEDSFDVFTDFHGGFLLQK